MKRPILMGALLSAVIILAVAAPTFFDGMSKGKEFEVHDNQYKGVLVHKGRTYKALVLETRTSEKPDAPNIVVELLPENKGEPAIRGHLSPGNNLYNITVMDEGRFFPDPATKGWRWHPSILHMQPRYDAHDALRYEKVIMFAVKRLRDDKHLIKRSVQKSGEFPRNVVDKRPFTPTTLTVN